MGVHVSKHDYYFWFYLLIHVSIVCLLFSMQRNKGSQRHRHLVSALTIAQSTLTRMAEAAAAAAQTVTAAVDV